jgi:uncharacterized membrane protein required for colicin V production
MSVSLIAGLLIVWQVLAGFARGAVRSVASLIALVAAILLSPMVGTLIQPLVAAYATNNPVWERAVAVGTAALFLWLLCIIGGRVVQHIVAGPREPLWSFSFNKKLGLFIGFVEGVVLAFVFLWMVYFLGTVAWLFLPMAQNKGRAAPPDGSLSAFLIRAKADLKSSPVGAAISELDPTPQAVYDAAALIGVLADQPDKRKTLLDYPAFQRLQRIKAIDEALSDPDLNKMVRDERALSYYLMHPKIIALVRDKEAREAIAAFDWSDALKFVSKREAMGR